MSETPPTKSVRKGTKSCVECRKQKVRCIWPPDANVCQRCTLRGRTCVAQTYSRGKSTSQHMSSRERTSRLEEQVARLEAAVRSRTTETLSDDSEPESIASAVVSSHPPAHLQNLFENHMLQLDNQPASGESHEKTAASVRRSYRIRKALQQLIPPREDVNFIAKFLPGWLSLLSSIFPMIAPSSTANNIIRQYDEMQSPDIDPAALAFWILSISLTALQTPHQLLPGRTQLRSAEDVRHFADAVRHAMETTFMPHESVVGSIPGFEATFLFIQLEMACGKFRKGWLGLQRMVAIAQSIGLPRSCHSYPKSPSSSSFISASTPTFDNSQYKARAAMWSSICAMDRVAGMMFNLPASTRCFTLPKQEIISPTGQMIPHGYLISLADIATKLQDLEYFPKSDEMDAIMHAEALKIDSELRLLANRTPQNWWDNYTSLPPQEKLMQGCHCYIRLRTHLPFTLSRGGTSQFAYSRFSCREASRMLLTRYPQLRRSLPKGLFISHIIDLTALTALVVMLLTQDESNSSSNLNDEGSKAWSSFEEVTITMKAVAEENDSNFGRRVVDAILALKKFLKKKDGPAGVTLRVPLIGKMHIRRNIEPQAAPYNNQTPTQPAGQQNFNPGQFGQDAFNPVFVSVAPDELTSLQWTTEQLDSMSWLLDDEFNPLPDMTSSFNTFGNSVPELDLVGMAMQS